MAEKVRCEACDRTFKDIGGLDQHNAAKHPSGESKKEKVNVKKMRNWGIFIVVGVLVIWGLYWMFSNIGSAQALPPTSMDGHIEATPPSHVLRKPMDINIQKHMLEHVDGEEGGRGGIIINYNCDDYNCESGLIEKLEAFAGKYDNVYVAPFKNMPTKIALTALGRIEVLDEYDEDTIEIFITGRVPQRDNDESPSEPLSSSMGGDQDGGESLEDTALEQVDQINEISIDASRFKFSPRVVKVKEGESNLIKLLKPSSS